MPALQTWSEKHQEHGIEECHDLDGIRATFSWSKEAVILVLPKRSITQPLAEICWIPGYDKSVQSFQDMCFFSEIRGRIQANSGSELKPLVLSSIYAHTAKRGENMSTPSSRPQDFQDERRMPERKPIAWRWTPEASKNTSYLAD